VPPKQKTQKKNESKHWVEGCVASGVPHRGAGPGTSASGCIGCRRGPKTQLPMLGQWGPRAGRLQLQHPQIDVIRPNLEQGCRVQGAFLRSQASCCPVIFIILSIGICTCTPRAAIRCAGSLRCERFLGTSAVESVSGGEFHCS
jgi:hypothetical protein